MAFLETIFRAFCEAFWRAFWVVLQERQKAVNEVPNALDRARTTAFLDLVLAQQQGAAGSVDRPRDGQGNDGGGLGKGS